MRSGTLILVMICGVAGCASKPVAQAPEPAPSQFDDAVTASLVFEPPVVASEPPLEISRQGRGPAAHAGFEEIVSTYYYLWVDDRQLDYNGRSHDRFERRAVTTRVGVTHR